MKVEIPKYPTDEDWLGCKDSTMVTVGKHTVNPPTKSAPQDQLITMDGYMNAEELITICFKSRKEQNNGN